MSRSDPALSVSGLRVRYPDTEVDAVSGIAMTIRAGELVLLTGPSGCGKSTVLQALRGIVPGVFDADVAGVVEVDGSAIAGVPVSVLSSAVGLVLQDPAAQLCNLTVETEVAFGPENLRLPPEECRRRVAAALESVSLTEKASSTVDALSGGECQRLAIASVLAMQPRVVLLDEPTATLDPASAREVIALMRELAAAGHAVLVVQHDFEELLPHATTMLVMEHGRITHDGPPREVVRALLARPDRPVAVPAVAAIHDALGLDVDGGVPLTPAELASALGAASGNAATQQAAVPSAAGKGGQHLVGTDLRFRYARAAHEAVGGVDIEVPAGSTLALIGRNGSGKSTLARLLSGLLRPRSGAVTLRGRPIARLTHRTAERETAYVFQFPEHQFVTSTVRDEIAYGLRLQGLDAAAVAREVGDVAARLQLDGKLDRHPFTLSGGEKRRLSVATMVVLRPALIVLDEPTYGLDEANLEALVAMVFAELRSIGTTIVVITHDLDLVARHADTAVVMSDGGSVFAGTPAAMFSSGVLESVGQPLPSVVRARELLRDAGWPIDGTVMTVPAMVEAIQEIRQAAIR